MQWEADEFTVDLVSNASMNIFDNNVLSSFRNQLSQPLQLEGDWRVALSQITFPESIKNVSSTKIRQYTQNDPELKLNAATTVMSRPRRGKEVDIRAGIYNNVQDLLAEIKSKTTFTMFEYKIDKITQLLTLEFGSNEGISFEDDQIPSILGFEGLRDLPGNFVHIGYKSDPTAYAFSTVENKHEGSYPIDLTCGSQLIFVYLDAIEHQYLGDTRAPILRIIESERRLKNGGLTSVVPVHQKTITNLDYKKLITSSIQNLKVELRTETGKLVPFIGVGKVIISLRFKKFAA